MENETYVSIEDAIALKNLGFDGVGRAYIGNQFYPNSEIRNWNEIDSKNVVKNISYTVPTLYDVQSWLRNNKQVYIDVLTDIDSTGIFYNVRYICNGVRKYIMNDMHEYIMFSKYEQALEAGIKEVLKILIQKQ